MEEAEMASSAPESGEEAPPPAKQRNQPKMTPRAIGKRRRRRESKAYKKSLQGQHLPFTHCFPLPFPHVAFLDRPQCISSAVVGRLLLTLLFSLFHAVALVDTIDVATPAVFYCSLMYLISNPVEFCRMGNGPSLVIGSLSLLKAFICDAE